MKKRILSILISGALLLETVFANAVSVDFIAPCFLERQGRDNLFSKELARLARPVYFAGDTLSEFMLWVVALFGFSEWKQIPEDEIEVYQTQICLQSYTGAL